MFRREWLKRAGEIVVGSAASLVVFDSIVSALGEGERRLVRMPSQAMGTRINTNALGEDADHVRNVLGRVLDEIDVVDSLMTIHRDDSDLAVANRSGGREGQPDFRTLQVARDALALAALTDGAIDPTVLPLMRHWGFAGSEGRIPSSAGIEAVIDRVGYRDLRVAGNRLVLDAGREIDFGGIAKGYAVDRAVTQARSEGVGNVMIEAGGDLYAAGRPDPGRRWTIGIRDPARPARLFATIDVEDEAVATSGGYEKFRLVEGRRIPHILDPRTGRPSCGTISATIIAPTTIQADALSTATFVLGIVPSMDLVTSIPEVEGLWVDQNGRRWMTPGLENRIQFV